MQEISICVQERNSSAEERIIAEVLAGNTAAYNQIIERYWARIFARVYNIIGNHEDAEEVTQDAFTRALRSLPRFRGEANFSTWLYQIASNLARNRYWYWKRRRRERSLSLESPLSGDGLSLAEVLPGDTRDPSQAARWRELCAAINRELNALPGSHRSVMERRLFAGESYETISEALGIPLGTVKSRIARARESLGRGLGMPSRSELRQYIAGRDG